MKKRFVSILEEKICIYFTCGSNDSVPCSMRWLKRR